MIFDVLSSLIIGVSAVRQVSFYLSVKKRGLIVMQMLLIAALTFIYGLLQGLFVRTAFALFSTVLMLGLCAVSFNEDNYCKAYNALSQGAVSMASIYLADSISEGYPFVRMLIILIVNLLWCLIMFRLRLKVFNVMPLPTGLYKKPLRICIVFYFFLLACTLGADHYLHSLIILNQSFSVMIIVVGAITIVVMLNMFVYSKNDFAKQQQLQSIEAQNHLMKQYVDDYVNYSDKIRIIEHDQRHLLTALTRLLQLGDIKKALDLLAEMTAQNCANSAKVFCNNNLINAILMDASQRCGQLGVAFHATARIPEPVEVEDVDLASLLMNIVNNAIESCERQSDKENVLIDFCIYTSGGCLAVRCENTIDKIPKITGERIASTKEPDGRPHGIGLESIAYITNKYDGDINIQAERSLFSIKVVIQNGLDDT